MMKQINKIRQERVIELVKAKLSDIPTMQALVISEVKEGIILNRSEDEVATNIRSYVLAKKDGVLVGYTALHIHSKRLAEIRSLIVDKNYRNLKIGQRMVEFTLKEAKELAVEEDVLVLTYLPAFFEKLNFKEINKELIPEHKIWADCIKCIHFPVCNETALVYKLV
jgi:amino-acid N-acetyltransferase